jgi:hypothetical protein
MARNNFPAGGVLLAAAVGVVVLSWLGLVIAGRHARLRHRGLVLRVVLLVAALSILAATVALGGMKWLW